MKLWILFLLISLFLAACQGQTLDKTVKDEIEKAQKAAEKDLAKLNQQDSALPKKREQEAPASSDSPDAAAPDVDKTEDTPEEELERPPTFDRKDGSLSGEEYIDQAVKDGVCDEALNSLLIPYLVAVNAGTVNGVCTYHVYLGLTDQWLSFAELSAEFPAKETPIVSKPVDASGEDSK